MQYDFDKIIDRHGKDALAIDSIGAGFKGFAPERSSNPDVDEIPMWIADMNFETCPSITRALEERISHPLYGYFRPTDEYYDRIIRWQQERHDYPDLTREMIGYENGVHGCIMTAINALTQPGDPVLLHTPAYQGFFFDLNAIGRKTIVSPLKKDENNIWRIDYEDMERKLKENHVRFSIFCSPHNPTGRVWEREELEQVMDIYRRCDCVVISDEIWSDIIFSGHRHIPTASVSEDARKRTVGLYAPSKTFNLAGLVGSYHIIYNPLLREKIARYASHTCYNNMNVLSMHALIGAYTEEGNEWTSQLNAVLERNCRYAVDFINSHLDGCSVSMPQGTYMLFMDCAENMKKTGRSLDEILKAGWEAGVAYQDGRSLAGPTSIRMNCALPFSRLQEAMRRLQTYVF